MRWPGLFWCLSAGLIHSVDVWCPFSHSAFELKLPCLRMKQNFLAPVYTQVVSHNLHLHVFSMSPQNYRFPFLSLLCRNIDSWGDGQFLSTSLWGPSIREHGIPNMKLYLPEKVCHQQPVWLPFQNQGGISFSLAQAVESSLESL